MSSWALFSRTVKTRMSSGRIQDQGIPTIEEETEAPSVDGDTGSDAGDRPVSQVPWGALPSGTTGSLPKGWGAEGAAGGRGWRPG